MLALRLVAKRSQLARAVLNLDCWVGLSTKFGWVPATVKRIPKWSEPKSGRTCHSRIRLANELVANVKSKTLSLIRPGRKYVPVPGVLISAKSLISNQSTNSLAPKEGFAKGSHQG